MVSDAQMLRNDDFIPGAGGTQEISRWWNHRISAPPNPQNRRRALEGSEKGMRGLVVKIAQGNRNASRALAGAHPDSGMVVRPGSGGFTTG